MAAAAADRVDGVQLPVAFDLRGKLAIKMFADPDALENCQC